MLLGKRPRNPMKRTTSLSEITFDLNDVAGADAPAHQPTTDLPRKVSVDQQRPVIGTASSPRNHRRASADFLETPSFLRSCALCNRRLVPGRDIFMYRGDSAFCSSECRQQQMIQDERREKCSMASKKELTAVVSSGGQNTVSATGETTVAAI